MEIARRLGLVPVKFSASPRAPSSSPFGRRTASKQDICQLSATGEDRPQLCQRTPRRATAAQRAHSRVRPPVSDTRVFCFIMIPFSSAASGSAGLRTDLQAGSSFLGHPEQSVAVSSTEIAQKIRLSHKKMICVDRPMVLGGLVKGLYVTPNLDGHLRLLPRILPAVYCIYQMEQ